MSDYLTDLGYAMDPTRYAQAAQQSSQKGIWDESLTKEAARDNTNLTFEDMLLLMVTQLQNQTIDNQADTNDMMNQLIQMSVMQAMTEMSTQVEELTQANVMGYAASLLDKEVTVGVYNEETKKIDEIVGKVTATGIYDGQPVIFLDNDKSYTLNSIMAVGRLPEKKDPVNPEDPEEPVDPADPDEPKEPEGETTPPENGENVNKPVEETGGNQQTQPETSENGGTEAAGENIGPAAVI